VMLEVSSPFLALPYGALHSFGKEKSVLETIKRSIFFAVDPGKTQE